MKNRVKSLKALPNHTKYARNFLCFEHLTDILKRAIIPTCGMKSFSNQCCLIALMLFCVMLSIPMIVFGPSLGSFRPSWPTELLDEFKLISSYCCTVFVSVGFIGIIALVLVRDVHYAISVPSVTVAFIASLTHFLIYLGIAPASVNNYGQLTVYIQWAEWTVTVPLLMFIVGHVAQLHPKAVFSAMLAQSAVILLGFGAEVVNDPWCKVLLLIIASLLYSFVMVCLYIVCVKLSDHRAAIQMQWAGKNSGQDQSAVKVLGMFAVFLWSCYPVFFYFTLVGGLSDRSYLVSRSVLEVVCKAAFLGILNVMQFKLQITAQNQIINDLEKGKTKQTKLLRFVYHEVHNPLNAIMLALDHLEGDSQIEQHRPIILMLRKSASSMFRVIQDVVELSKHQGGLKLCWERIDLELTFNNAISAHTMLADDKGVKVNILIGENIPLDIMGDSAKLQKVFETLLSNAIKFSSPGTEISVSLKVEKFYTPELCMISFEVKDNGPGIPEGMLANIFEPYGVLRPGDFIEDENRGSGLSLCMLKHLTDLLHAEVAYNTEEGKGTMFTIYLRCEVCKSKPTRDSISIFSASKWSRSRKLCSPMSQTPLKKQKQFFSSSRSGSFSNKYIQRWGSATPSSRRNSNSNRIHGLGSEKRFFPGQKKTAVSCVNLPESENPNEKKPLNRPFNKAEDLQLVCSSDVAGGSPQQLILSMSSKTEEQSIEDIHKILIRSDSVSPFESRGPENEEVRELKKGNSLQGKVTTVHVSPKAQYGNSIQNPVSLPKSSTNKIIPGAIPLFTHKPINNESTAGFSSNNLFSLSKSSSFSELQISEVLNSEKSSSGSFSSITTKSKRKPNLHISLEEPLSRPTCAEILIVDDVQSNAKLACMILMKEGFFCEIASNGQEAVNMARRNRYNLILMDNVMPVLNGVEATRQILQFDSKVTIVGVTGNILPEDMDAFMEAGAKSIIQKPATKAKLLDLCELYLRTHRKK